MNMDTMRTLRPSEGIETTPYISANSKMFHQSAMRAVDFYLKRGPRSSDGKSTKATPVFLVAPDASPEALLAQVCDSLTSICTIINVAAANEEVSRNIMLALQQVVMMGEMAVSRMLENYWPNAPVEVSAAESETGVQEQGEAV